VGGQHHAPAAGGGGGGGAGGGGGGGGGVERLECAVDHPPPSSAEVKERVELYL
jgi:hypothetical protein